MRHRLMHPATRGQALVEFAIVLPVMLFLLLMAIDFGRLFFSYVQINNAAREGAAYGAANPGDLAGITARADQETDAQSQRGESPLVVTAACTDSSGTTMACSVTPGGGGAGNRITVTAVEPFTFLTPLINSFFGGGLTMSASSTSTVLGFAAGAGGTAPPTCSPPSLASFTVSASGLTVNVDASASTPVGGPCAIAGYNWDMGDGADPFPPVTGLRATYTYANPGTYTITLDVANAAGDTTATQSVTVPPAGGSPTPTPTPTATPTASPTSSAPPSCPVAPTFTATFTGNGKGAKQHEMQFKGAYTGAPAPTNWSWSFGDGNATSGLTQQTVLDDYQNGGTYSVSLTITAGGGCQSTVTQQVSVP